MRRLFKLKGLIFPASSRHFNSNSSASNSFAFAQPSHQYHFLPNPSLFDPRNEPGLDITTQLSNCSQILELNEVHAHIVRTDFLGFNPAPFYWNNIIRSYTRLEAPSKAIYVHVAMLRAGITPDCYTLPIVLKAVCQSFAIEVGQQVHSVGIKVGLQSSEYCESGFINLYCKGGDFESARKVFEENSYRKLGSWNAMIGGLSQAGLAKDSIDIFIEMRKCGFVPDGVTMVSVASACGSLGDLNLALQLHKFVFQVKAIVKTNILMWNSLIDVYGKCGRMDLAYEVFVIMEERNVSSWTSMIVGYAMHGHVKLALECFQCMREAGMKPNYVTFIGVLSACVHGGAVQEGRYYFDMLKTVYGITPQLQHYGCMVDLLGRAGLLEDARKMAEEMPMKPNSIIWGCLMGACEKHGHVDMAEWVAKHLQALEPWSDGAYVVLSNIYANKGLWKQVEQIRLAMKHRSLAKVPAYSLATKLDRKPAH